MQPTHKCGNQWILINHVIAIIFSTQFARYLAEVKRSQHATLSAPLSLVLLSVHANHPWLVAEPKAVEVPGWQTGTKALCLYHQSPQAFKPVCRAPDLADNSLDGVECTEHHPSSGCVADIVSVTMCLLSINLS